MASCYVRRDDRRCRHLRCTVRARDGSRSSSCGSRSDFAADADAGVGCLWFLGAVLVLAVVWVVVPFHARASRTRRSHPYRRGWLSSSR